jgi:hypothetical protein
LIDYVSSKKCFIHFVLIVNWKSNNYLIISCTILIYLYLYWKGSWNQAIGRGRLRSFAANDAWDSTLDKKSRLWSGTYVSIGCTIDANSVSQCRARPTLIWCLFSSSSDAT